MDAHTLQVGVNRWPLVQIFQSTGDVRQLEKLVSRPDSGGMLTSFSRLVSGCAVTKSMIVPYSIHSETMVKVFKDLFAPVNGNTFGCLNCFHNTTSRQKAWPVVVRT